MPTKPDDQPLMGSWFLRIDRFADTHLVAAQNKDQSCGLASIKMVVFKINKLRPGASALATEGEIEREYKKLAGEKVHDFDAKGAKPSVMVQVLNSLGLGNWAIDKPPLNDVGPRIAKYVGTDQFGLGLTGYNVVKRGYPVILACYWAGGGGHAIVVDTVTSVPVMGTYATICDPWDANVHFEKIEAGKPFTYRPKEAAGVNLWGDVKGVPSGNGTVKAIIYCQKSPGFWS
ncbi:MAG TPA: papain-like cysteine protease family protein [Fimbriiglobus sp.]|jgi:hypothetical protein|nr:papain-like cysteine protease family protein [Fimbriiglobus sp.]